MACTSAARACATWLFAAASCPSAGQARFRLLEIEAVARPCGNQLAILVDTFARELRRAVASPIFDVACAIAARASTIFAFAPFCVSPSSR
jgi:hypothetical protein